MADLIQVMFCCNNPDNGQPEGYVCSVVFPDEKIEMEGVLVNHGPMFREERRRDLHEVRIGHRLFAIQGYRSWVGNWCWDVAWVTPEVAGQIFLHLVTWGFTVEAGPLESPEWIPERMEVFDAIPRRVSPLRGAAGRAVQKPVWQLHPHPLWPSRCSRGGGSADRPRSPEGAPPAIRAQTGGRAAVTLLMYDHVWYWRSRLPERKGQRCRVLVRGRRNTILVEFADGYLVATSRRAVRRWRS